MRVVKHWFAQRGCGASVLGDIQNQPKLKSHECLFEKLNLIIYFQRYHICVVRPSQVTVIIPGGPSNSVICLFFSATGFQFLGQYRIYIF